MCGSVGRSDQLVGGSRSSAQRQEDASMRSRLSRFRLTPAVVISGIAMFFAIGGIGYAVTNIGTNDIKDGAVTKAKVHKNAIVSKKVKNGSLLCKDLKEGCVQGPQGPAGPAGPAGTGGGTSTNATTVNGLSVQKVFFKAGPNTPLATAFSAGGLTLRLGCDAGGNPLAEVASAETSVALQGEVNGGGGEATYSDSNGFTAQNILGANTNGSGRLTYSTTTGTVLTM